MDRVRLMRGDITSLAVDAIVNAANTSLLGGGGVDGAIHRAAGPELLASCREIGGCAVGEAVITPGFRLPARFVIHTVGPIWRGGAQGEPELLASCYRRSLHLAIDRGLQSVAFPAISCGAYGYPIDAATAIAVREVRTVLDAEPLHVTFICFDPEVYRSYGDALAIDADDSPVCTKPSGAGTEEAS
ncbi:MAG: O-acetyl-ADP-ribose deacetylase [Planctomycetes bacterium]|nr:O-acetyl-ADP-ribose deacetylase [Planctomycetota bacterium]